MSTVKLKNLVKRYGDVTVVQGINLEVKPKEFVVLVGPSGCGKTTIWKILKMAYEKMGQPVSCHVMNPKSMPREQLLGLMNNDTREF